MIRRASFCVVSSAVVVFAGCGGGSSGSPGNPSTGGPVLPGEAATITVNSNNVSPREVTVPVGSRVNFVNRGNSTIEMASDPHPVHSNCAPLNQVGGLRPGETGQTGVFEAPRRCGFHDHGRGEDERFMGTIIVQ